MEIVGIGVHFLKVHPNMLIIADFVINCYTYIDYFLSKAVFLRYFGILPTQKAIY